MVPHTLAVQSGRAPSSPSRMADPNVKAAFDKFDADASGSLERGELLDVLHELGLDVRGDEEFAAFADALMEDYDSDGDGRLDFAEFEKLYNQCLATAESRAAYAEELRSAVSVFARRPARRGARRDLGVGRLVE